MKIYLFGGYERKLNQFEPMYKLIGEEIKKNSPEQILHVPFAFQRTSYIDRHKQVLEGLKACLLFDSEFLNAAIPEDLKRAKKPLIFICGGQSNNQLLYQIKKREKLLNLIYGSEIIIGESAGAMIPGEYLRSDDDSLIKGLKIISDTIIEPHYTERNYHQLLVEEMKKAKVKYGIGIDCVTGLCFELADFPNKYEKIGNGLVEVKRTP